MLTLNATVQDIVERIREFIPQVQLSFVNSPIMNQLSYEVSCQRFLDCGFAFSGDLRRGIGETMALLAAANGGEKSIHGKVAGVLRDGFLQKV